MTGTTNEQYAGAAGSTPLPPATDIFQGSYRGELIQFPDPLPTAAEFVLERYRDTVTGRYTLGSKSITIKGGTVIGKRLYFLWESGSDYGQAVLESRDDGSLAGTWGYREARAGAGTLTAHLLEN